MGGENSFSAKLGDFVIKFRWLIIIGNILIIGGLFAGMANRGIEFGEFSKYMQEVRNNPLSTDSTKVAPPPIFNTDYHVFFQPDNPNLVEFDAFQRIFAKEDNLLIVVKSKSGNLFTKENLTSLKTLVEKGWEIPWVNRVDGLTNFNYTYADEDDLLVEDLIEDADLSPEDLNKKRDVALQDSLIPRFLISKKGDLTQINLRVVAPVEYTEAYAEAGKAVRALKHEVETANSDLEIKLGGIVMLNNAFAEYASRDIQTLMPIMYGIIFIILMIVSYGKWGSGLSRFWRVLAGSFGPMVLLITSIMFPIFLYVGWMGFSLTNVSFNVIQMLIAVAIADSVHIITVFFRALKWGMNKKDAVRYTIKRNFVACLITSVTTAIGFYSLLLQAIPPFQDLGLFAGTGTLYAFLASILTMPAILTLLPFKPNENPVEENVKTEPSLGYKALAGWVVKNARLIQVASVVMTVASVYFLFNIEVDSTAVKYFGPETEFRQATEYIDGNILGTNPLEFNFKAEEPGGIYEPEFLKKIESFQRMVMSDSSKYHITYVSSIVDVVKRLNKSMHGDDPAYYTIPEEDYVTADGDTLFAKNLIAQYMFLYTMSLPQGMELTNQIDLNAKQTRATAFMTSVSSKIQVGVAEQLTTWLGQNMPEMNARAVGVPLMFGKLMAVAIPGMLRSLAISLLLITIVLIITFRSVRVGLYSMIPNVWPILVIFGTVGLVHYTVNLSVAVVGMITLGIAVDDTVHFLVKYLMNVKDGYKGERAIAQTYHQVGAPLIFTSIILVLGFGSLMFSDFALNSDLGKLCSSVIALALIADFIVLPAVILFFESGKEKA